MLLTISYVVELANIETVESQFWPKLQHIAPAVKLIEKRLSSHSDAFCQYIEIANIFQYFLHLFFVLISHMPFFANLRASEQSLQLKIFKH